ncbi:MAG: DoxX family membrane protein [Terriglobales bacterium]
MARHTELMLLSSALLRTIAAARIATSIFFLLFGEYKVADPAFAHGGFQTYLQDYITTSAVSFYRPFLSGVVQPHAVFFGYFVGVLELFVGVSLLLGLWVRPACVAGGLFLINMVLCTWWEPGHSVPVWRYFGAELEHLPLLLLLIVFYAADAGRVYGLDGWRRRSIDL